MSEKYLHEMIDDIEVLMKQNRQDLVRERSQLRKMF